MKKYYLIAALLVLANSVQAQGPNRVSGMEEEIEVKSAKDLGISAPSGKVVAVLDQHTPTQKSDASPAQDHHNGWLRLSTSHIEGGTVKVRGKLYVPRSTTARPETIQFTIRKRSHDGLVVYSDKSLPVKPVVDKWMDFEIELPIGNEQADVKDENYILMLSATPLAGPVYLAALQVTDPQNNQLWEHPEFE